MSVWRNMRLFLPQQIPGVLADCYDWLAAPGLIDFHRRVASEIACALGHGRVLDVGTGPGYLLAEIARQSPRLDLVGIDLSEKMLHIAASVTRRLPRTDPGAAITEKGSTGSHPVRLVRGDVHELPFPDGHFDLVVSTLSLHHWRNVGAGIRECLRVTAPGGCCWIYDLRADVPAGVHARCATGERFRRWLLGWIFTFHGVCPGDFTPDALAGWIGGDERASVELNKAYLKLCFRKMSVPSLPGVTASACPAHDTGGRPLVRQLH